MKTFWARRPHVIEVVQFDGKNFDEIRDFCADWISSETTGENPSLKIRVMGPVLYKEEKMIRTEYIREVQPGMYIAKTDRNPKWPFQVMDIITLNTRYAPITRGKASEIECNFYKGLLDASRICD